ncbi:MAG TPA: hypothetical protein DCY07_03710 [Rhodospirillaceae bacterium]|nr:hypothetical protein [Rhodospirillaceae bacterium]
MQNTPALFLIDSLPTFFFMTIHHAWLSVRKGALSAFVDPFRDKSRSTILLAGALGSFAYGAQSFVLNFQLGGMSLETSLVFQIMRFSLLSLIGIPLSFWIMSKENALRNLVVIQFLGTLLFFVDFQSGIINAVAFAVTSSPFCAIYNYNFALKQTNTNRNNETALSQYSLILAGSLGLLVGGYLLEMGHYAIPVLIGCLGGGVATILMFTPIPRKNYATRTRIRLGWKKPSNRITFFASANAVLIDSCLPIWMNVIGLSPLTASINMAVRPFLGIFLTPLFSFLMKKGPYETAQYITGLLGIGWMLMMASYFWPALILVGLTVLMAAANLMSPLEMARWFKRRSVSATIAREALLASGRVPAYLLGIPIIFMAPLLFPVFGFAVGVFFAYGIVYKKERLIDRLAFWRWWGN